MPCPRPAGQCDCGPATLLLCSACVPWGGQEVPGGAQGQLGLAPLQRSGQTSMLVREEDLFS